MRISWGYELIHWKYLGWFHFYFAERISVLIFYECFLVFLNLFAR